MVKYLNANYGSALHQQQIWSQYLTIIAAGMVAVVCFLTNGQIGQDSQMHTGAIFFTTYQ